MREDVGESLAISLLGSQPRESFASLICGVLKSYFNCITSYDSVSEVDYNAGRDGRIGSVHFKVQHISLNRRNGVPGLENLESLEVEDGVGGVLDSSQSEGNVSVQALVVEVHEQVQMEMLCLNYVDIRKSGRVLAGVHKEIRHATNVRCKL